VNLSVMSGTGEYRRRALSPASPPGPACRVCCFAAVAAGSPRDESVRLADVSAALSNRLQPTRQDLRQTPADQAAFADRLSTSGFVEAKSSARPDRGRCPKPGSTVRWRVRCRELIS